MGKKRSRPLVIVAVAAAAIVANTELGWSEDAWRLGPSMKVSRSEIDAAKLGDAIYVAGGIGFFRVLRSCESFSISESEWRPCAPLPRALHHVAMASAHGKVFASGGYTSLGFSHDKEAKLWSLEPGDSTWSVAADLPEPIGEHALVEVGGELYMIGGRTPEGTSARVWQFDFTERTWTGRADMPTARHSTATLVIDDEIWVLGGRSEALGTSIDKVEVYTPQTDEWRTEAPMPQGRGGHAAAHSGGRVHVFGGETFDPDVVLDRHDIYDIKEATWRSGVVPPKPRHGSVSVNVEDEIYLVAGGARPTLQTIFSVTGTVQILSAGD